MAVEILVSFAVERVNNLLKEEVALLSIVKTQVQSLQTELTWMLSYLKDADSRYEEGDATFRTSIKEIRSIAYDVEDLVDSFILESCSRRRHNPLMRYTLVQFQHLVRSHQLGTSVKSIKSRIMECTERLVRYGVRSCNEIRGVWKPRIRRQAYPHVEEHDIVGLDEDIEGLAKQLVDRDSAAWVVSVVGMGGSGKTTLAREVYNSGCVKQRFGNRAWVSISQSWDRRDVLLEIHRQFVHKSSFGGSDQGLVEEVYGFLKEEVYLIVLDDVWKLEAWEDVFPALPRNNGSKVLITTRIESVPMSADPNCIVRNPHILSEKESWELFRRKAFVDEEAGVEYEKMGKEMVKKCNGLPLAVAALGGLLRTKRGLDEWKRVENALTLNIMKGKGSVLYGRVDEMLALSYHDLSYDLKPCFLYLGLFPEDYDIKVGMLIRMWIAEGFVRADQVHREESLEEIARERLDELIYRCLLQVTRRNYAGKVTRCRMHDLIHDLCLRKAKEQDYLEILPPSSQPDSSMVQARRATIDYRFFSPTQSSNLRSLVRLGPMSATREGPKGLNLDSICTHLRLLRVLNLWGVHTHHKRLPWEIGSLIHLRYLGIRFTNIRELPQSIGNLRNLLTLDYRRDYRRVRDCMDSVRLPNVLWKMAWIRHIYLPWGALHSKDRLRLETLQDLRTLWGVGGGSWITRELMRSSPRIQKLAIANIDSEEQLEAVFRCPSIVQDSLRSLSLNWLTLHSDSDSNNGVVELPRLELDQSEHLQKMILQGRIKEGMPLQFPRNLTKLELYNSQINGEDPMESIGKLQSLKYLWLWNAYSGSRMTCKDDMFPKLEYCMISFFENLEDWRIEEGAMPVLKKLNVSTCHILTMLPEGLRYLGKLEELALHSMPGELLMKLKRAGDGTPIDSEEEGYMVLWRNIPLIEIFR